MRLICIFLIIFFILSLWCCYSSFGHIGISDVFLSSITSITLTLLSCIILCIIIDVNANTEEFISDTQTISCLNDNSSINGSKYLFSGYINEKQVYKTFVNNKDGSKSYKEINANKTKIYEDGENKIVTYGEKLTNKILLWLMEDGVISNETRYEIHIPPNSITTDYNIDLN